MEIPNQEAEMPIPLNSTYGGGHAHHAHTHMMQHHHNHHHHQQHHQHHHDPPPPNPPPPSSSSLGQINVPSSGPAPMSSTPPDHDDDEDEEDDDDVHDHGINNSNNNHHVAVVPFQKPVKYRECLKNHAASMGGNATDGCGEFMPSGEDGTLEALTCSACSCHRNFHRKETTDGGGGGGGGPTTEGNSRMGRKVYLGHRYLGQDNNSIVGYHRAHHYGPGPLPHHPMIMSYNMPSESDEMEGNNNGGGTVRQSSAAAQMAAAAQKKRFRTKFSPEQKEKMLSFAEKVGWKIQKQEEGVVQQFCQEVGVKRRVLKVWMHNNKHNLAKKQQQLQLQQQPLHHQHHPNNNNSDLNQV